MGTEEIKPASPIMQSITQEQLHAARQQLLQEPELLDKDSANESDSDTQSDGSEDMVLKINRNSKRRKREVKDDFNATALAFQQANKIGKLRTELGRTEERLRYLQLEYNNKGLKVDELEEKLGKFRTVMVSKKELILSQTKEIKILKIQRFSILLLFGLYLLNQWFNINSWVYAKEIAKSLFIFSLTAGNFCWGFIGQGIFKSKVMQKITEEFDTILKT